MHNAFTVDSYLQTQKYLWLLEWDTLAQLYFSFGLDTFSNRRWLI
jgi:hypothetical protein